MEAKIIRMQLLGRTINLQLAESADERTVMNELEAIVTDSEREKKDALRLQADTHAKEVEKLQKEVETLKSAIVSRVVLMKKQSGIGGDKFNEQMETDHFMNLDAARLNAEVAWLEANSNISYKPGTGQAKPGSLYDGIGDPEVNISYA